MTEALILLVGGLFGAVLGAYFSVLFPRAAERRKATFDLIERYNSSEMFVVRAVVWRVKEDWDLGDYSILRFFVVSRNPSEGGLDSGICANGLSVDQNLSWFLHFFGNLAQYYNAGLVDKKLINIFFNQHYLTYRKFFAEFVNEFNREAGPEQPAPSWLVGLPQLEEVFEK